MGDCNSAAVVRLARLRSRAGGPRRLLVHVVDGSSPDPCGDFAAIRQELALFSPALAGKRQIVAYNKIDLPDSADYKDIVHDFLLQQVSP